MLKHARTFLAWSCFVFVVAAFALIGTLSPSYRKCAAAHERDHGQQKQAKLDQAVTGRPQIPLLLVCEGAFIDENSGTLTALATIAIAAFTLTLWRATTEHSQITGRVLALSREEFIATHRPKIIVRSFDAPFLRQHIDIQQHVLEFFKRNVSPHVFFSYINVGDSAANIVDFKFALIVGPLPQNATTIEFALAREHAWSGSPEKIVPGQGAMMSRAADFSLTENVLSRLIDETWFLYCVGWIRYRDELGTERRTGWHRRYEWHSERFITVSGSDHEYAD
jgi:hypothetical protein